MTRTPGVNLVGYLDGEFGLGEAGRMLTRMIRSAGAPLATTALHPGGQRHDHPFPARDDGPLHRLNVLAVNAAGLISLLDSPAFAPYLCRPSVGVWYWEVDRPAEGMARAFAAVDEVWCASDYIVGCLQPWTDTPVRKHPLVVDLPTTAPTMTRADLGLPEHRFLFGLAFDHASVLNRKNPLGLIEAYRLAFRPDEGAALVIKTINGEHWPADAAMLRRALADRPDIQLHEGHLDAVAMRAFYGALDAYVSLHRSEGLGLTLAAAMAAGVPVVATGWSGNLELMGPGEAILLPYRLVEVGPDSPPYPPDATWAEPDLGAATAALRRLFDDPDQAAELGRRGRDGLAARCTPAAAACWFRHRFAALTGIELPA